MSGVQAMHAIRKQERQHSLPRIPIVFITAHASREFAELDIDNVIAKPISRPWLLEAISVAQDAQESRGIGTENRRDSVGETAPITTSLPRLHMPMEDSSADSMDSPTKQLEEGWFEHFFGFMDAPPHLRSDANMLWRYRTFVMMALVMMLLLPVIIFSHFSIPYYGKLATLTILFSYMVYPLLMRLQARWIVSVYTVFQQALVTALCVTTTSYGMDALRFCYVFPPILALVNGSPTRVSAISSFVVVIEGLIFNSLMPVRESNEPGVFEDMFFIHASTFANLTLATLLTSYLAYSSYSRHKSFHRLAGMVRAIQRTQEKTARLKDTAKQFVTSVAYDFRTPLR